MSLLIIVMSGVEETFPTTEEEVMFKIHYDLIVFSKAHKISSENEDTKNIWWNETRQQNTFFLLDANSMSLQIIRSFGVTLSLSIYFLMIQQ